MMVFTGQFLDAGASVEDFGIKIFYFVREVMICYLLTADQSQARTGAC